MWCDDESTFPLKLVLTIKLVSNFCKAFTNNSGTKLKLSNNSNIEIIQSGGFLG